MTMTLADAARLDDGVVTPRADQPKRRMFTAEYKARILDEYGSDSLSWPHHDGLGWLHLVGVSGGVTV